MNITEAKIIALNVQAMAVQAEIAACQAHDRLKKSTGESGFYTEETYVNLITELRCIADELKTLANSGGCTKMRMYAVRPKWLCGDDKDAKREAQLEILNRLGIRESESIGMAICNAEQVIELLEAGYCGPYVVPKEHVMFLYDDQNQLYVDVRKESDVDNP